MKAPFCSKALEAKACLCIRTAASLPAGAQDLPARSSRLPGDGAGRGSASSATKGRDSLPARGCPQGHPQPPDPPLPPRTHTGHPSVLREERSGAESGAGRPPAGPRQRRLQRGGEGRDAEGRTPRPRPRRARHQQRERRLERGRPGPESRGQGRKGERGEAQHGLAGHGGAGMFLPALGPASIPRKLGPCSLRPHVPAVRANRVNTALPKP